MGAFSFVGAWRRRAVDWLVKRYLLATGRRILKLTRTDRIGHLMGEIDAVMKEERLMNPAAPRRPILLVPSEHVANRAAARAWHQHADLVESARLNEILQRIADDPGLRFRDDMFRYYTAINETAAGYAILREWGDRGPLLSLDASQTRRGDEALRALGLPDGARFVCFHCRGGGYSPADEVWHTYRNSDIDSYLPAIQALVDEGFYGVRMGDPTMPPLPPMEGVVDYVHSEVRSDWMDVFLCARAEFFLGDSSGLYFVSLAYGRPLALVNLAPTSTAIGPAVGDIGIPKILWNEKEDRPLRFREVLATPVGNYRFAEEYDAAGLRAPGNDAEDVTAVALEMLARSRGDVEYDERDEALQKRYQALFSPGHYAHGAAGRVGRDFLRKHAHLLD